MMRFVGPLLSLLLIASIFNAAEPLVFAGEAAAAGDVASTTTGQRTAERRRSDGQVRVRRGYDDPRHLSQRRLRALAGSGATKLVPQKGDGVVYRRTDRNGGKPYVGQSKNESRFRARQQEHARGNPYSDFRYEVLGREAPGAQLERMEEYFIRQLGGPTNLRNPFGGIANRRHQMRYRRYDDAGGGY